MGTKRVGWARIRSLINENTGSFHFKTPPTVSKFDLGAQVIASLQSDGSVSSGGAGETNYWNFRCGNQLAVVAIGGQTLLGPNVETTGINVTGDNTNNDGWEIRGMSSLQMGRLNKDYFTVGTSPPFYAKCKFSIADISDVDDVRFGFAQADEAYTATTADYTDAAWIKLNDAAGDVYTGTILADTHVNTDLSATTFADGATHTWEVRVGSTGITTFFIDGTDTGTLGGVAYTFADGLKVTPMWLHLLTGDDPGIIWQTFEFGLQAGNITNAALDAAGL